jgi:hypothetical protein
MVAILEEQYDNDVAGGDEEKVQEAWGMQAAKKK